MVDFLATALESLQNYGLLVPLVQLLFATLFGFIFAERWQRWRQRRDFQYRTLLKFAELSYDLMDRLSELLMNRAGMPHETFSEKRRAMVTRWTLFVSMRAEVLASYGRGFVLSEHFQGMFNALNTLREYARAPEPIARAEFEPVQEKFLALHGAVVAEMVRAMGLMSRRHHRAELRAARARVQQANVAEPRAEPSATRV